MILSDRTLREKLEAGQIEIDPLGDNAVQPSSIDLRIDRYFRVFRNHTLGHIDVKQHLDDLTELVEIEREGVFILHPGEFVLGSTLERVRVPTDLVARLEGKSSLGRLGLLIHSTAGFVDAGWNGQLTLEEIDEECISGHLYNPTLAEPDLLIRTANEQRVSNFLLWQISYSEFYVTKTLWPDFNESDLEEAILAYSQRERRFGDIGVKGKM